MSGEWGGLYGYNPRQPHMCGGREGARGAVRDEGCRLQAAGSTASPPLTALGLCETEREGLEILERLGWGVY